MNGNCTPLDTGPGHMWCVRRMVSDLEWRTVLLVYLVLLAVTWTALLLGSSDD